MIDSGGCRVPCSLTNGWLQNLICLSSRYSGGILLCYTTTRQSHNYSTACTVTSCIYGDVACGGFNHSLWIISFSSCSFSRPSPSTATFFALSDVLGVSSSERRQRRGWEASLKSGSTRQMRCVQYMLPLNHTDVPTVTSQVSIPVFIIYSRSLHL